MGDRSAGRRGWDVTLFGRPALGGVELSGGLAPTILSLLAVRPDDVLDLDLIIDQLYRDEPPASAAKTVQNQIVKIRRLIEETEARCELRTVGSGYRLSVEPHDVDVLALEHALDTEPSASELDRFRRVWRNEPFVGCRPAPLLEARALHLSRLVGEAVQRWSYDVLESGGDPAQELEWALSEHPFSERLWVPLIRSHLQHERTADARRALGTATSTFEEELGIAVPAAIEALRDGLPSVDSSVWHDVVGRRTELDRLAAVSGRAAEARGAIAIVSGPAGIGKTTIARAAIRAARRDGLRAGWGRSWPDGQSPPYWPWREALNEAGFPEIELPPLPPNPAPGDIATHHHLVGARLLALVRLHGPLVVVLDDLHQADPGSVLLVAYLADRIDDASLSVIATTRSAVPWEPDIEDQLVRARNVETVVVGPWPIEDLTTFASERLGADVHEQFADRLLERTGGNPFVAERLLLTRDRPPTGEIELDALLADHLDQVRADIRTVVEVCGVAASPVEPSLLAEVAGRSMSQVIRSINAATEAGFLAVRDDDTVDVRHPAVAAAVMRRLPSADERALHDALASVLARESSGRDERFVERIARHALAAVPPGAHDERALDFARAAGRAALSAAAPSDAARWFREARLLAEVAGSPVDVVGLLLEEGRALGIAGDDSAAAEALTRAASIAVDQGDPALAAAAATELLRQRERAIHRTYEPEPTLVAAAELALTDKPSPVVRAMACAALATEAHTRRDHALSLKWATEACASARDCGDPEAEARALVAKRTALALYPERISEWVDLTKRAEALAESAGDAALRERVAALLLTDAVTTADVDAIVAHGVRYPADAARPVAHAEVRSLATAAQIASATGRYDDARTHLGRIAELASEAGTLDALVVAFYAELSVALDTGYTDELVAKAEFGARARPLLASRLGLAMIYGSLGRVDDARRTLVETCSPDPARLPRDDSWLFGMTLAAHTSWLIRDERFAASLSEILAPFDDLCASPGTGPLPWFGAVALHAATSAILAGRLDEASARLDRADEIHERLGTTPWLLRGRLARASLLYRRGGRHRAEAEELRRSIQRQATELGATVIADQAAELRTSISAAG